MLDLIWLIPLLPFVGFLANMLFIRRERDAGYVATGAVGVAFVLALIAFIQLAFLPAEGRRIDFVLWDWISTGSLRVPFGLLLDPLSGVMMLLVTGVGTLIHLYSIGYMHNDARVVRYFAYLNLFVTMMLFLVMADNLLLLFLGWEGVGLCSFLLIGHWFERKSASDAAVKAFVVNRIGDAAFLVAMMAIFSHAGTLTFFSQRLADGSTIPGIFDNLPNFSAVFNFPGEPMTLASAITFLMLIGVTGKSAQVPLFVWLPDAMAGPTPVSALIHAATMVTAGVYLMARMHGMYELAPATQTWVIWIGALTAFIGGTAALSQWDIKRVLAYSTVSQLGYMVAAAGMGLYVAALFHLLTHGIFKALLFLGSGSVIHGTGDIQDMRRMGGLKDQMRTTWWTYMVGALALSGVFPLAGFWSKDEIISNAFASNRIPLFILLFLTSLLTAFYMGRQVALVFYGQQRDKNYHAHESPSIMTGPLIILAVGAVIAGAINLPGVGGHFLTTWLQPVLEEEPAVFGTREIVLSVITTLGALGMFYLGLRYYINNAGRLRVGGRDPLYRVSGDIWEGLSEGWYVDNGYRALVVRPYRAAARFVSRVFDPLGIDGIVNGVGRALGSASGGIGRVQSGYVRTYALVFLLGVVLLVGYFVAVNR